MDNHHFRLIQGLTKGDRRVFEEIFNTYYAPLCSYCLRYVSGPEEAEEIVQDLFFKLWVKRNELAINTSLQAYLYRAVRNYALNYLKHKKTHKEFEDYVGFQTQQTSVNPVSGLEEDEMQHIMKLAVLSLPEKRREIFEMSRYDGLKNAEIAEKLNLSLKTVENQMTRAFEQLRVVLREYLPVLLVGLLWPFVVFLQHSGGIYFFVGWG
ncbi:MAG: RNA polymerase sigma-70 factor [Bacteroidales bacterium]|nr:RNA polymerase sigma-70 factor [Bacteroidales bacterium]